jgi:predicted lipoprotein
MMMREPVRIAIVGFNTQKERPVANKKFDDERRAAAYLLEILLRDSVEFVSIRKIRPSQNLSKPGPETLPEE